mgnify:FL=1|jgi:hypothetical protein|tara:strand:+ start:427 stop:1266 length:840 start_codon:yes stop_codon:yes gene_type:complete
MIKEIPKSDVVVRPFKVYKEWASNEGTITPLYGTLQTDLYDVDTDDTNSDGTSKRTLYDSIKSQFYLNPATSSILTEVGKRKSYASTDERVIGDTIGVISIPQQKYGEGLKIGSVELQYGAITVTDDSNSNLIDSASNHKGNVYYDRGLIVLTKDIVEDTTIESFELSYRSTMTIYENEVFLSVNENEFNISQNPSAYDGTNKIKLKTIQSTIEPTKFGGFGEYDYSSSVDTTGSYLAPFITTIGLYDNELNMVAVCKLPKPIKSLPDYPLNFIVRFDT